MSSTMNVVIVGERLRDCQGDEKLVTDLIDALIAQYASIEIISTGCDRGIGKIVKNRVMSKEKPNEAVVNFNEVVMRIFAKDMPKTWYYEQYNARNATLVELGHEFHIFMDDKNRGTFYDLYKRVQAAGLPHSLYYPLEKTGPKLLR